MGGGEQCEGMFGTRSGEEGQKAGHMTQHDKLTEIST